MERDALGRKVRTEHVGYTNEYFYDSDDKNVPPSKGVQTWRYDDGSIGRVRDAVYSAEQKRMVFIRDRWYDKKGDMTSDTSFDPKTGKITKEKEFKKNAQGILFMHRKEYKEGAVPSEDVYIHLGGGWFPLGDKENYKVLNQIENPFAKEDDTAIKKAIAQRAVAAHR